MKCHQHVHFCGSAHINACMISKDQMTTIQPHRSQGQIISYTAHFEGSCSDLSVSLEVRPTGSLCKVGDSRFTYHLPQMTCKRACAHSPLHNNT